MQLVYAILAGFCAGAACASAVSVLVRSWQNHRPIGRRWEEEHARLVARVEPYLASAREQMAGDDLGTEAEQWLGSRPEE